MDKWVKASIKSKFESSPCKTKAEWNSLGLIPLNYDTVESHHNILILGAGPSLNINQPEVIKYIDRKHPLIIGTHYNFFVPSDFCAIIGKSIFGSVSQLLTCKNFIITPWVYVYNKSVIDKRIKTKQAKYYVNRTTCKDSASFYWNNKIECQDGSFGHWLGNCGFMAMLAAHFFKPKEILIAGFDGPRNDGITVDHFNGKVRTQKGAHRNKEASDGKGRFLFKIIEFLNKQGIKVIAFDNDGLWKMKELIGKQYEELDLERIKQCPGQ